MSALLPLPADHLQALHTIRDVLDHHHVAAWLVGGYVRDLVRGAPGSDLDLAVDGPALDLARAVADHSGGAFVELDAAHQTARIVWSADRVQPLVIDLARLRAPTIAADLVLRDITINALALPLDRIVAGTVAHDALLDPLGGLDDLQRGVIRLCGPRTLADDPLRMLRVARFAAQFGFAVAPEADAALRHHAPLIADVVAERVREELLKLLAADHAASWLAYLDDVRLLTRIVPELEAARDCTQPHEHYWPVLAHVFETVAAWEWLYAKLAGRATTRGGQPLEQPAAVLRHPDLHATLPYAERIVERMEAEALAGHRRYAVFKLAALLHDIAKPATKQITAEGRITFHDHQAQGAEMAWAIARRLRFSRSSAGYVRQIVAEHMRPGQLRSLGADLTERAVWRLLRDTGEAAPDVLLHALCDHMAVRGPHLSPSHWAQHLAWTAAVLELIYGARRMHEVQRLIGGDDLLAEFDLTPGPLIGRVLLAVQEAQALGDVRTRAEALALAERLIRAAQAEPTS
jgi:putative nucleotidyltransferase with HDIG domain